MLRPGSKRNRWITSVIHGVREWTARHGAVGADDRIARRFGAFGEGTCLVYPPGVLFGEQWIRLGRDTLIGPGVSITAGMVPGQKMVTDPVVTVGDRCMIGRESHIVGHFSLEIGDDVHTGPHVYVTDQNHGYENPDEVVHTQWPSDVAVSIGSGSWLGTGAVILPGTFLGRNVVVGAGAVVRGTFPDHCVVAGVPARVVRRHLPGRGWVSEGGFAATVEEPDAVQTRWSESVLSESVLSESGLSGGGPGGGRPGGGRSGALIGGTSAALRWTVDVVRPGVRRR